MIQRTWTERIVVVLSGPVCAGKSSVANQLVRTLPAQLISARGILVALYGKVNPTRAELIEFGAKLEAETQGSWLAQPVRGLDSKAHVVVDSARTRQQLETLRSVIGSITHVHVDAPLNLREGRFRRSQGLVEDLSFADIAAHPIERGVALLASGADLKVESADLTPEEIASLVVNVL